MNKKEEVVEIEEETIGYLPGFFFIKSNKRKNYFNMFVI
jgi:hypothetical protein